MSNAVIRKAIAADATGIAIVAAYTWATAYSGLLPDSLLKNRIEALPQNAGRIKSLIEKGTFEYAVAVQDNAVIGFCGYGKSRNPKFAQHGEISALYILKGFAGKGIGREIFEFAASQLKAAGCEKMIINCLEGNPSLNFYIHMGGNVVGSREDEIFGGYKIKEHILEFDL